MTCSMLSNFVTELIENGITQTIEDRGCHLTWPDYAQVLARLQVKIGKIDPLEFRFMYVLRALCHLVISKSRAWDRQSEQADTADQERVRGRPAHEHNVLTDLSSPQAYAAGWSTRSCTGRSVSCPGTHSDGRAGRRASPRGSPTGSA